MFESRKSGLIAATIWGALLLAQAACGEKKEPRISQIETDGRGSTPVTSETTVTPVVKTTEITGPVTFEDGEVAFGEKKYDEATKIFQVYTTEKPQNPWGFYMLGLSSWKSNDLETAETAFLKTVELDPSHVKGKFNLGRVYLDKGEPDKAVEQFTAALLIDSNSAEGYRLLGRAQDEQGLLVEAEHSYRQAIKLDSADYWAMNNLAMNFILQDRPGEALGVLARVVEIKPDNTLFQNNLGMALELNGYFVKASESYAKAVELDTGSQKAMENLARVTGHPDVEGLDELNLDALAAGFATEVSSPQVSTN